MKKVITYGTFDLLHYGHIRLLERAKALGDYLIVGVTSDEFDKARGKINVRESVYERMENVRKTGLADEIIIESYEGQKIDDIKKYDVDTFVLGSDWAGKFDYLKEYCEVVYLDRTEGISSTDLRDHTSLKLGLIGKSSNVDKVKHEAVYVDGLEALRPVSGNDAGEVDSLLSECDAVYVYSVPGKHYELVKKALNAGKHVLVESPVAETREECRELFALAKEKNLTLMEGLKTAYSTAFQRLLLLLKGGKIGRIVSVDAVCTSQKPAADEEMRWGSIADWGPTALLPVFSILGTDCREKRIVTWTEDAGSDKTAAEGDKAGQAKPAAEDEKHGQAKPVFDRYTKVDFRFDRAVASVQVGKGMKSEGELVISGTEGYAYVPAPWWKTDFFEIRYENTDENQRYFYQLEGEGIRYELVAFLQAVGGKASAVEIPENVSEAIAGIMEDYAEGRDVTKLAD